MRPFNDENVFDVVSLTYRQSSHSENSLIGRGMETQAYLLHSACGLEDSHMARPVHGATQLSQQYPWIAVSSSLASPLQ